MNIVEKVALEKNILRGSKIFPGWWRKFLERQNNVVGMVLATYA